MNGIVLYGELWRSFDREEEKIQFAVEALRRASAKFAGRQKVHVSNKFGFTKYTKKERKGLKTAENGCKTGRSRRSKTRFMDVRSTMTTRHRAVWCPTARTCAGSRAAGPCGGSSDVRTPRKVSRELENRSVSRRFEWFSVVV